MKIINKYIDIIKKCKCGNDRFYVSKDCMFICTKCKYRWPIYHLIDQENKVIEIVLTKKEKKLRVKAGL
jgi:hypothetical protein